MEDPFQKGERGRRDGKYVTMHSLGVSVQINVIFVLGIEGGSI
jgi:hypothetical protein